MCKNQKLPIRIAHWGLLGGHGGIEMFIMNLYRRIDRNKVQFDFLREHDAAPFDFEDEIADLGGRVYRVMYSRREAPFTAARRLTGFFIAHSEFSGVHVHANFPYAAPLKSAKRAGISLRILHSHNAQINARKPSFKERLRNYPVRREIDVYPTHYFACSNIAAQWMFPGKPYLWIKNGIDTIEYEFSVAIRHRVRASLGVADSTVVLGFCGRLRNQKNPVRAVEIFAELHRQCPNSVFMVVGDGELRHDMEVAIQHFGLPEYAVIFMGGERSDVNELYQGMDVLLMPSNYEGLPLVLIEAQTAGLPCLASSEAVTVQAKVSDLLHFESLQSSNEQWAQKLLHMVNNNHSRDGYADVIRNCGFDIATMASYLENFYLRNAGRN